MKKFFTIAIVAAGLAGISTSASAGENEYKDFPTWEQQVYGQSGNFTPVS